MSEDKEAFLTITLGAGLIIAAAFTVHHWLPGYEKSQNIATPAPLTCDTGTAIGIAHSPYASGWVKLYCRDEDGSVHEVTSNGS